MRITRLFPFLVFLLLASTATLAQDSWVTGDYRMRFTVGTNSFSITIDGYEIASLRSGPHVRLRMSAATAKAAGISTTLKGKRITNATLYKKTASGKYLSYKMTDLLVSSVTDGTSNTILTLDLGGQELGIISPRDPQSGLATKQFSFGGQELELGGNDWE